MLYIMKAIYEYINNVWKYIQWSTMCNLQIYEIVWNICQLNSARCCYFLVIKKEKGKRFQRVCVFLHRVTFCLFLFSPYWWLDHNGWISISYNSKRIYLYLRNIYFDENEYVVKTNIKQQIFHFESFLLTTKLCNNSIYICLVGKCWNDLKNLLKANAIFGKRSISFSKYSKVQMVE